jgi:hypothetical protein
MLSVRCRCSAAAAPQHGPVPDAHETGQQAAQVLGPKIVGIAQVALKVSVGVEAFEGHDAPPVPLPSARRDAEAAHRYRAGYDCVRCPGCFRRSGIAFQMKD